MEGDHRNYGSACAGEFGGVMMVVSGNTKNLARKGLFKAVADLKRRESRRVFLR
jgi:hypothetical protein